MIALHRDVILTRVLLASVTLFGIFHLIDLHKAAAEFRSVTTKIRKEITRADDYLPVPAAEKNHVSYLLVNIGILVVSGVLAGLAASCRAAV